MRTYLLVIALLSASALPQESLAEENVMDQIVQRCRTQMSEYGASMVKACVDQDVEALTALGSYPDEAMPAVQRCAREMSEYGFAMVKACADQDLEAERQLSGY